MGRERGVEREINTGGRDERDGEGEGGRERQEYERER